MSTEIRTTSKQTTWHLAQILKSFSVKSKQIELCPALLPANGGIVAPQNRTCSTQIHHTSGRQIKMWIVITSLQEEQPQTTYHMSITWASYKADSCWWDGKLPNQSMIWIQNCNSKQVAVRIAYLLTRTKLKVCPVMSCIVSLTAAMNGGQGCAGTSVPENL